MKQPLNILMCGITMYVHIRVTVTGHRLKNETVIQINHKFFRVSVTKMVDHLNSSAFHISVQYGRTV